MLGTLERDPGQCFLASKDAKQRIPEKVPLFFQIGAITTGYKQMGVEHLTGFRELRTMA